MRGMYFALPVRPTAPVSSARPRRRHPAPRRLGLASFVVVCWIGVSSLACSSTAFVSKVRGANEEFAKAKALGAERYSPYEYYAAEVRLQQAKYLAAEAEYGTAMTLVDEASRLSREAIDKTNKLHAAEKANQKEPSR
jgi:hypothetical protein